MGILNFFKRAKKEEGELWFTGGAQSQSGETVTEDSAMRVAAVYSCVRLISQTLATLPCILYSENGENRDRARDNPLYNLLHYAPNPYQTAVQFFEAMQMNLLLRGNAYAIITWTNDARTVGELNMISPERVTPEIVEGVLKYKIDGGRRVLGAVEMLHIAGPSLDGIVGLSPIDYAKETIGNAQSMSRHSGSLWKNGAKLSGILKHPGKLTPQAIQNLRDSWTAQSSGSGNSGKTAILENGMEFQPVTMTTEQAKFIEERELSRSEIAGIFNVPPHMIGDLKRATFSNIEHQSLEFVTYTLRPWFVRWESAIKLRLLANQPKLKAEFNADALLRGDFYTRQQGLAIQRQNGVISIDEWRALENRNPLPGGTGTDHMVPMNMAVVGEEAPQNKPADGTPNVAGVEGARERANRALVAAEISRIIKKESELLRNCPDETAKVGKLQKLQKEVTERMAPIFGAIAAQLGLEQTGEQLAERFTVGHLKRLSENKEWKLEQEFEVSEALREAQNGKH